MFVSIFLLYLFIHRVNGYVNVTLGIPCFYSDLKYIEQLNKSIVQQTSVPDEIILVVSGAEVCPSFVGWTVVCLREQVTAGIARNLAWKLASSDVVSFIDADDEMYPERISVIRQYFSNEPDLQLLLHDSAEHPVHEHTMYTYPVEPEDESLQIFGRFPRWEKIQGRTVSHGHMSILRTMGCPMFGDTRQAEDTGFIFKCLKHLLKRYGHRKGTVKALRVPLTRYVTRAHQVMLNFKSPFDGNGGLNHKEKYWLLRSHMMGKRVAEWGIGDSTILAKEGLVQYLVGIDSSSEWVAKVQELVPRFDLRHVDIGPVGAWGYPLDESNKRDWPHYSLALQNEKPFDIYFVDGRFRVACLCQALLHGHWDSNIVLHDYTADRPWYNAILEVAEIGAQVDKLAMLKRKPDVSDETIWKLWEKHKYDIR